MSLVIWVVTLGSFVAGYECFGGISTSIVRLIPDFGGSSFPRTYLYTFNKTTVSHPEHIAVRHHILPKYWYIVYQTGECSNLHSYHHVNLKSQSYVKVIAVGHCTKLAFAFLYSHLCVRLLHIPFCVLFASGVI